MKVLKFGGTSIGAPERIRHVGGLIKSYRDRGEDVIVVFSAFSGVTNDLVEMSKLAAHAKDEYLVVLEGFRKRHFECAKAMLTDTGYKQIESQLQNLHDMLTQLLQGVFLVREATPRTLDYVYSFGERNSCFILSEYFKELGLPAKFVDARQLIKTNKNFGAAKVNSDKTSSLIREWYALHKNSIPVITGFISSDIGGLTTTLGRGGSDYTAAIFAATLDASALEIWTDVDGVLTCDPKKVKKAYTIRQLSYNEAMELSHFGAKVIYPPTIQPALNKDIPIYIRNSFNSEFEGTLITKYANDHHRSRIKGLSSISDVTILTVQGSGMLGVSGTAARMLNTLAAVGVNIIMISQGSSEHSICLAIKSSQTKISVKAIREEFARELVSSSIDPIVVEEQTSIVAIVGEKMKKTPGVAGKLFSSLGKNGINVKAIAQGSSELNISFAIDQKDENKALNLIHDSFFLSEDKTLNVFITGVGLIGSTLLKQIKSQREILRSSKRLKLKIVGLANSKTMLFDSEGIELEDWRKSLAASELKSNIKEYIRQMKSMNLPNSVFVDNTASALVANQYIDILSANISISTANKIAASSSYAQYLALKRTSAARNVSFLFETNVGAGLPVISTLNNLILSGDRVLKIEAILSGSLSYIFNHFSSEESFHSIVVQAMKKGLTEPDPREDLSGKDIQRKITILARESGYPIEPEEVVVQNILPQKCISARSVDAFLESLMEENVHFEQYLKNLQHRDSVLRFMAKFENGKASVELVEVLKGSPFFNISESDNMIAFTTERYRTRPLIVKGPGAGSEVTAAGVFSEIISIGNT